MKIYLEGKVYNTGVRMPCQSLIFMLAIHLFQILMVQNNKAKTRIVTEFLREVGLFIKKLKEISFSALSSLP